MGSGKKSMEGLLSLHLVVGLKYMSVSWADDGEEKLDVKPVQFSSVQLLSRVRLFATP